MSAPENKQLMERIFAGLSIGDRGPFRDAMAEDFSWTIIGSTDWSRTYRGKQAVGDQLIAPLFAQFADTYTNTAERLIAEDDFVVVECRGRVSTRSGRRYDNTYCYVVRLADGKLQELTEYCDTELISSALDPPGTTESD